MAKVKTVHVPYKSTPPALIDLIAGQTQFSFISMPAAFEQVRSRKAAHAGADRQDALADGDWTYRRWRRQGCPASHVNTGFGFVGPVNLPRAVVRETERRAR